MPHSGHLKLIFAELHRARDPQLADLLFAYFLGGYKAGIAETPSCLEDLTSIYEAHAEYVAQIQAIPVVVHAEEVSCHSHPDAPHGFNRTASHSLGRYVCDCEGWVAPDPAEELGSAKAALAEAQNDLSSAESDIGTLTATIQDLLDERAQLEKALAHAESMRSATVRDLEQYKEDTSYWKGKAERQELVGYDGVFGDTWPVPDGVTSLEEALEAGFRRGVEIGRGLAIQEPVEAIGQVVSAASLATLLKDPESLCLVRLFSRSVVAGEFLYSGGPTIQALTSELLSLQDRLDNDTLPDEVMELTAELARVRARLAVFEYSSSPDWVEAFTQLNQARGACSSSLDFSQKCVKLTNT